MNNIELNLLTPAAQQILESFKINPPESKGLIDPLELSWLLALFSNENGCYGNIIEVGCHLGHTTKELARMAYPRIVYAIDYRGIYPIPNSCQEAETPPWSEICINARNFLNVVYINANTQRANFEFPPASYVFIDGDHTYTGVANDYVKLKNAGVRIFVFHDALPDPHNPWIGVYKFLQTLDTPVYFIPNTRLAVTKLP